MTMCRLRSTTIALVASLLMPALAVAQEPQPDAPQPVPEPELVFEREVFELLLTYEPPPLDELQTVPLLENETASSRTAAPGGN